MQSPLSCPRVDIDPHNGTVAISRTSRDKAARRWPVRPRELKGSRGTPPAEQVLWIDDEIRSEDAAVVLLRAEGLQLDVANSGLDGLRRASARKYAAIILDVRLPDIDGLAVLEQLTHVAPDTPIMVLSGHIDMHGAGRAVRLGVRDLRMKPLFFDELATALRKMLSSAEHDRKTADGGYPSRLDVSPTHAGLKQSLHDLLAPLTQNDTSAMEYVALTNELRQRVTRQIGASLARHRSRRVSNDDRATVRAILGMIEKKLSDRTMPHLERIADEMQLTPNYITLLLENVLSLTFRECRRALRVRPALHLVGFTEQQYAQIAYQIGYEHPTQFTRDFRRTLGISPHEFRALGDAR